MKGQTARGGGIRSQSSWWRMGDRDRANFPLILIIFYNLICTRRMILKKEKSESWVVLVLYTIYVIVTDLSPGKDNLKSCLLPFLERALWTLQRHLFQPHLKGHSLCSKDWLKFPILEIKWRCPGSLCTAPFQPSLLGSESCQHCLFFRWGQRCYSTPARGWNLLVSSPFPSYLSTMVSKVLFFFVFFFLLDFGGVFKSIG